MVQGNRSDPWFRKIPHGTEQLGLCKLLSLHASTEGCVREASAL